jgi:antitoxin component HigA of HigAB toxin-antitoxin module
MPADLRYNQQRQVENTMEPRMIKNQDQHRRYLAELERLAELDPDPDSPEGTRLMLLAKLVDDFEKSHSAFG